MFIGNFEIYYYILDKKILIVSDLSFWYSWYIEKYVSDVFVVYKIYFEIIVIIED